MSYVRQASCVNYYVFIVFYIFYGWENLSTPTRRPGQPFTRYVNLGELLYPLRALVSSSANEDENSSCQLSAYTCQALFKCFMYISSFNADHKHVRYIVKFNKF